MSDIDGNNVQIFTKDGVFLHGVGQGRQSDVELPGPHGIAVEESGPLYVSCKTLHEKAMRECDRDKWDTYMLAGH